MDQSNGTIFISSHEKGTDEKNTTSAHFHYVVNESWVGVYPYMICIGFIGLVMIVLWITSLFFFPSLLGFEQRIFELITGASITIDVIDKVNTIFFVVSLFILLFTGIWLFNYWRYQILGEWHFTPAGLEIKGHYSTMGSEHVEYEYVKTIVTFRRQHYDLLIPGLGEIASLYMFWKYKLSEIELRTELSYLNSKGEHQPVFVIDYVEDGEDVAKQIRAILNASKDKNQGWRGLPPGLFRMRR